MKRVSVFVCLLFMQLKGKQYQFYCFLVILGCLGCYSYALLCLKPNIVQSFHLTRYSTLVLNKILYGTHLTKCHTCRVLTFY
jgi:hypothetical protein